MHQQRRRAILSTHLNSEPWRMRHFEVISMAGIDESLSFLPLRIAVLTVSDTRDAVTDSSGALLIERLTAAGHDLAGHAIVRDEVEAIRDRIQAWVADPGIDIILSTGGTGFTQRDVNSRGGAPTAPAGNGWIFRRLPRCQPGNRRRLHAAVARTRRADRRDLHLLHPRIDRRLPRCLG